MRKGSYFIPVTYPQEVDLATDEDEELRDIRANVSPLLIDLWLSYTLITC